MTDLPGLPGSHSCVGCGELTFRARPDQLCPRCAYEAEHLIEQIELDCLNDDLVLLTRFEAYCRDREERQAMLEQHVRAERVANRGLAALPPLPSASNSTPLAPSRRSFLDARMFDVTSRPLPFPRSA